MLTITNAGPAIVATNYWSTNQAQRGAVYVSVNAGAFRLLLPDIVAESILPDLRTALAVIVSRGAWPAMDRPDAIELLFDDASDTPFALHLGIEQIDRLPRDSDARREWRCSVWIRATDDAPHLVLNLPAHYRRVRTIPDLSRWRG